MRKLILNVVGLCVLILTASGYVHAQNAQVTGIVKDSTGAVIAGATATAMSPVTGLMRTSITDSDGRYTLVALPPGNYTISVALKGFTTINRPNIILQIDQTATLDFSLGVATTTDTVTVTSEAPVVDTTQAASAISITQDQISDLPVATRRWIDMAMLTPATSQDAIRSGPYRGGVAMGGGLKFYANAFNVDGTSNNWFEMGEPRQNYGMDAVEEFKTETAGYNAEYGWATGGVLNVVTKSGTNNFHGDAFLFFRNGALNAIQEFQSTKPPYEREQFGGALGGPIIKDKLFFFGQYERTQENAYGTVNVPSAIWSQYNGTFEQQNYFQMYDVRGDYHLTTNQSLFVRFADEKDRRPINTIGGTTTVSAGTDRAKPSWSLVAGHDWVISANALNQFRFQYAWARYVLTTPNALLGPTGGAFAPGDFSAARLSLLTPVYTYPSVSIGTSNTQMGQETRLQFKDDFTYTVKNHQFKVGVDWSRAPFAGDNTSNYFGTWTFPKDALFNPSDTTTYPTSYTQAQPTYAEITSQHISGYIQDTWHIVPRLTLNLGLRWDGQPGGFNTNISQELQTISNVLGTSGCNCPNFQLPNSPKGESPYTYINQAQRGYWKDFGPRIGFAWDVFGTGRTTLHAATGLFTDNIQTLSNQSELTWPQAQSIIITNPCTSNGYTTANNANCLNNPLNGVSRANFVSTAAPNISLLANNFKPARAMQVDAGVSQVLPWNIVATAEFVYVHRYNDRDTVDVNLPATPFVTGSKPDTNFGHVSTSEPVQYDNYKALLIKVEKRLSNRFQMLGSYTETRAQECDLSNAQGGVYGYVRVCGPDPAERRHRLTVSGIVMLPKDMQLSIIQDWRSSLPFNPTSSIDINGDGYSTDLPIGVGYDSGCRNLNLGAINSFRSMHSLAPLNGSSIVCPHYNNVDLRFTKAISLGGERHLNLIVQVLNVFDYYDLAGGANGGGANGQITNPTAATFGSSPTLLPFIVNAPSRQVELAVRYDF